MSVSSQPLLIVGRVNAIIQEYSFELEKLKGYLLGDFNVNKSPRVDDIPALVLKLVFDSFTSIWHVFFSAMYCTGEF